MAFEPQAGEMIAGRYRLEEAIGGGGMGRIWRAVDQVLECPIAVKLVTGDDEDVSRKQQIDRFMREAKLSASVQHPAVVRVTDFGVHEDTPYIAMELLTGETLAARVQRQPLTQHEAVGVCLAVLRGLRAAHQVGVVHRDIKPENIQLVADADGLYPKLIDFGISLGTVRQQRISAVTTNGFVFGTPMYMSPEHARGLDVDGRADLYSVGIVLYEMLTGCPPFPHSNPIDLMAALARDLPPAPHEIRSEVSVSLSEVVMKAIAKEPMDRYQSAGEMGAALASATHGSADASGPVPASLERTSTTGRRTLGVRLAETLGVPALASPRAPWWVFVAALGILLIVGLWQVMSSAGADTPLPSADSTNTPVAPEVDESEESAQGLGHVEGETRPEEAASNDSAQEGEPNQAVQPEGTGPEEQASPMHVSPMASPMRATAPSTMMRGTVMGSVAMEAAVMETMVSMSPARPSMGSQMSSGMSSMRPSFLDLDY